MKSFPYPIPADALDEFLVPVKASPFCKPLVYDGETIVANGLVAMRVNIGRWLAAEFDQAGCEFLARIGKLPWGKFGSLKDDRWHDLEAVRIHARGRGQIAMRHPITGDVQASPVWRVGAVLVRLSVLQAVAKLPRVEVQWEDDRESPIWFRFSGGRGIIASDRRLATTRPARSIYQDKRDALTGGIERHKQATPKPSFSLPGWPPADPSEI